MGVLFAMTGSITVSFIPIYTRAKENGKQGFLRDLIKVLVVVALIFTILFELLTPLIAKMLAPSYSLEQLQLLQKYLRIFSAGLIFSLLANLLVSTLNAESIFGYAALSGLIFSTISIALVTFFHSLWGQLSLVLSVVIAYVVQCFVLFLRSRSYIIPSHIKGENKEYIIELFKMSVPVLVSNTIVEINHLVDRTLATGLNEGAVSALAYSNTLFNLVFQIVCNTFITIYFTEISKKVASNQITSVKTDLEQGISLIILFVMPIMIITALNGNEIVSLAFKRGSFDDAAVDITGSAISIYAFSFVLAGLYMLLNKVFYALNNYKAPTIISFISVVINIILSVLFSRIWGLEGIVISTVIANLILTMVLWIAICKKYSFTPNRGFIIEQIKCIIAGVISYLGLLLFNSLFQINGVLIKFSVNVFIGIVLYCVILFITKNQTIMIVKNLFHKKKEKAV